MLRFEGGGFLLVLALDIFCLIDVITSDESRVRNLPKIAWFVLILLFPLIGSIVWLAGGRPQANAVGHHFGGHGRSPHERPAASYPEYDRPGRASGVSSESDDEFLRSVRERAEDQRRRYAEEIKARERADRGEPTD
jgi:hypothetical protein